MIEVTLSPQELKEESLAVPIEGQYPLQVYS